MYRASVGIAQSPSQPGIVLSNSSKPASAWLAGAFRFFGDGLQAIQVGELLFSFLPENRGQVLH